MTHSECSWMKSRIVLALSVSDLRPPGLSQATESRSRWASPYCDVKRRARVVLPEPELPNTTMRRITFETARLTRIRLQSAIYFWLYRGQFAGKHCRTKIPVKNYMSDKIGAVRFIDCLDG